MKLHSVCPKCGGSFAEIGPTQFGPNPESSDKPDRVQCDKEKHEFPVLSMKVGSDKQHRYELGAEFK